MPGKGGGAHGRPALQADVQLAPQRERYRLLILLQQVEADVAGADEAREIGAVDLDQEEVACAWPHGQVPAAAARDM